MKPGVKTTEFWLTLVAAVLGVLVAGGFLTPEESAQAQSVVEALIEQLAGVVIAVGPIVAYIRARAEVKAAGK